jgi:hypothetical protein
MFLETDRLVLLRLEYCGEVPHKESEAEVLCNGKRWGCGVNVPMCKTYVYGVHKDRSRERTLQGGKFLGETIVKSLLSG